MMVLYVNTENGILNGKLLDSYERKFVRYTIRHAEAFHSRGSWFQRIFRRFKPESPEDALR